MGRLTRFDGPIAFSVDLLVRGAVLHLAATESAGGRGLSAPGAPGAKSR